MQPRANGKLHLSTKRAGNRSVLDALHQSGSSKCLFPQSARHGLEAVILNTAGGVTGGDAFSFSAHAAADTELTMTTQACERAYKAQPGQTGRIRNRLQVAAGARVNWLPQETILFDGCALDRRLSVDMDKDASLLMVEPMVFGRHAMGETLTDIHLSDRIEIRRADQMLYLDAVRLNGNAQAHLAQAFIAGGAGAMASVVYIADDAEARLDGIRTALPETAGASLIKKDVLVLRILAQDSFVLRLSLLPILRRLNGSELPRCWMT